MADRLASACVLALALTAAACMPQEKAATLAAGETPYVLGADEVSVGRHLAIVGGCNDCHTAGYAESGGQVPETEWLKGDPTGHYGPWGTTYASNLRLIAANMSAEEWVTLLHTRTDGRPPMPWSIMREYNARDLKALHAFIRSLGDPGAPLSATPLPPGPPPQGRYTDYLTHDAPPPGAAKQ